MKRTLLILTTLVAVATMAGCALFYPNIGSNESPSDPLNPSPDTATTEPSPSASASASESSAKERAEPRLLFYQIVGTDLQVIGEVVNFAEDGGECIVTVYSGNTPIVQERVSAEHNVTTTQCFPLSIPVSKLPKGTLELTIGYESAAYEGTSKRFEVINP
jgi:hypothetical protein